MNPTGGQIRAARALLDWTQADLANAAGLSVNSVKNIEGSMTEPTPSTAAALRKAFDDAGVILLAPGDMREGGHGVRLRKAEG